MLIYGCEKLNRDSFIFSPRRICPLFVLIFSKMSINGKWNFVIKDLSNKKMLRNNIQVIMKAVAHDFRDEIISLAIPLILNAYKYSHSNSTNLFDG